MLVVAAPLNSLVSSRSVKITQDLLKARDKRIGVMNELIGAIQFIKVSLSFFLKFDFFDNSIVLCLDRTMERSGGRSSF